MRVAYWNRLKSADAAAQAEWLAGSCEVGCPRWDVLLLAEVPRRSVAAFAERLGEDAEVADWTGEQSAGRQPHGLMAFSRIGPLGNVRFPSEPAASLPSIDARLVAEVERRWSDPWKPRRPLRERWISFDLEVAGRTLTIAGAQMPFAAGKNVAETPQPSVQARGLPAVDCVG